MIELLIALFVVSVGLFSALNLIYSNLALVNRDTDEVTAINLAREGVELAKEMRDSNWLAGNPFDQGMSKVGDPTDYTGTAKWTGGPAALPSFDFTANAINHANAKIWINGNIFQQTLAAGSTSTPFTRLLTFHPICDTGGGYVVKNPSDSPDTCDPGTEVGIRVESAIQWKRGSTTKNAVIFSDLYDWR